MRNKILFIVVSLTFFLFPKLNFGQIPDLGASSTFALFTAAGAFNGDAATSINGDIGTNVGAFTPPGFLVGQIHIADPVSAQAAADVGIAYGFLASLTCGSVLTTPLGNSQTLTPNIYCLGTASVLNADLILDGQGNPGAVFVFQIDGALSTNSFSHVILTNSANLCNVYWQINGAINIGGNSLFQGTVIADGAINLASGAALFGRGLSTSGAISTQANTVTLPAACNCTLDVTCPPVNGGTFQCISQIPAGVASAVTINSACGNTTVGIANTSTGAGCIASPYILTRTYTVTDDQGNTAVCTANYTAIDNTAPTITCPATVNVQCASLVPAPNTASVTVGTDNCGGGIPTVSFVSDVISNQTCANRFTITRTYQVSDACGNTATCAQTINVFDNIAPSISCPATVTVQCANLVPAPNTASVTAGLDNCGGSIPTVTFLSDVISNQTCANRFTITRTYQVSDACGNSTFCVQTINVLDNTPPVITCPATVTVQCANLVPAPNTASVIVVSNNCGGIPAILFIGDVISSQTCQNRFTITRTYQVTDDCGNSTLCIQTITVNDQTPPTITCLPNLTVSCAGSVPAPAPASIVTTDLCGGAVTTVFVGDVISNQTCASRYTITRTYRATDLCGNSATCVQIITVLDNTGPVFLNPPQNITVECTAIPPVVTPNASDNCSGPLTILFLGEIQTSGICPVWFTLQRSWSATDACGNVSVVNQLITVLDNTPPQFLNFPADVTMECNLLTNGSDIQDWTDSHGGISAFDCSEITWSFEETDLPNQVACVGMPQQSMRFTATDECGNSAFQDIAIVIVDMTPPVFTILPQNLEVECTPDGNTDADLSDWLDHFGYAEVNDACSAFSTEILFVSEVKGCGNTYTRTYEFRATDACGNTSYVRATFSVVDHTPPVIITCPEGNVLLTCEFDVPPPNPDGVIAIDNCGFVHVTTTTHITGVGCKYWPQTVQYWYMVTDACGNMAMGCDQSFQVVDSIPPIYTGPDTIYVACVSDLPGAGDVADILAPYMQDNCYDIICLAQCLAQLNANSLTYTVKAKDLCANWNDNFVVTFLANGGCKPLCTATAAMWGNKEGVINDVTTKAASGTLMLQQGSVTAGKLGKAVTATSADCIQNMLPGNGNTAQFNPGIYTFGLANNCLSGSPLLNDDGSLVNELAANVMALQLNMWYNLNYNQRILGVQKLSGLPYCMVSPLVLAKLETNQKTVQGLLNLSNDYLAGVGFFQPGFGNLLNEALTQLNQFWENCQVNDPCASHQRDNQLSGGQLYNMNLAPNPATDNVTLRFDCMADMELQIRFIGNTGVINTFVTQAVKGFNTLNFSTKDFPPGVYTVVLQHGRDLITLRLVKVGF